MTAECPKCHTSPNRKVNLGQIVICRNCDEVYEVESRTGATKTDPTNVVDLAQYESDESERPAKRSRRDSEPKSKPERKPSNDSRVLVVLGLALGFLAILGSGTAVAIYWMASSLLEQNNQSEQANASPPIVPVWPQVAKPPVTPVAERPVPQLNFPFQTSMEPVKPLTEPAKPVNLGPSIPAYSEPANRFPAGTQTKLRELRKVELPPVPALPKDSHFAYVARLPQRFAFAPKANLLFVLRSDGIAVCDVATSQVTMQPAKELFTDLSLSPDGTALFAADYGREKTGYGTPIKPSWVHRFDIKTKTWEARKAPKIAWRLETVDAHRFLLLEQDQWVDVSLNRWENDGVGIRELARVGSDYNGDMEYDPRTGHIYHGSYGTSAPKITVQALTHDSLKLVKGTGMYGSASKGGGSVVLSQDGSRMYYGKLQVDAAEIGKNLELFPEVIVAASRDIAFGSKAYYRTATGSKLGEYPYPTITSKPDPTGWGNHGTPTIHVSPDGQSVWILEPDANMARQFALEGAE